MINRIQSYFSDSAKELRKVNWLTLPETLRLTTEVICFAVLFAIIYGIADFIFLKIIFIR